VQSGFVKHPTQELLFTLQVGVAGVEAQSAGSLHSTQTPVLVKQTGLPVTLVQSLLLRQATQTPKPLTIWHFWPFVQPALLVHPAVGVVVAVALLVEPFIKKIQIKIIIIKITTITRIILTMGLMLDCLVGSIKIGVDISFYH